MSLKNNGKELMEIMEELLICMKQVLKVFGFKINKQENTWTYCGVDAKIKALRTQFWESKKC